MIPEVQKEEKEREVGEKGEILVKTEIGEEREIEGEILREIIDEKEKGNRGEKSLRLRRK